MSIAHFNPDEQVVAPAPLATSHDPNSFAVYDNETTPTYSLEASLKGSPWTVEKLYRQILGTNDVVKELDLQLVPAYQHYEKIEGLEILVQSSLSNSFDTKTQMMTLSGSAIVYSFLRLNVSDYFIATANMGRRTLFRITSVTRSTHEKNSVFVIEYTAIEEMGPGNEKANNLELKTSVTKVFSKARLIENLNPILLKERFVDMKRLVGDFRAMANDYFRTFFRPERATFFIPGQEGYIYDPFLVGFFNKVVGSDIVPDKQYLLYLSENNDPIFKTNTIWTLLERRGIENLAYSNIKMKMVTPNWFDHVVYSRSAFYANTDFTVYPDEIDESAHVTPIKAHGWGIAQTPAYLNYSVVNGVVENFCLKPTTNARGHDVNPSSHLFNVAGEAFPLYNYVRFDENYIFGESFFEGTPTSVLEIALLDYIRRDAINVEQVLELVKVYPKMTRLEQFYYGPMIMVLILEVNRGAYA